jgi:hypothetical protein
MREGAPDLQRRAVRFGRAGPSLMRVSASTSEGGRLPADGDRNAELSNANKSFAARRVTGDPPCSSPRRRATSTQIRL